jgi:uncharacterized membrane protein
MKKIVWMLALATVPVPALAGIAVAPAPVIGDSTPAALMVAGLVAVYFSVRYLRRRRG